MPISVVLMALMVVCGLELCVVFDYSVSRDNNLIEILRQMFGPGLISVAHKRFGFGG